MNHIFYKTQLHPNLSLSIKVGDLTSEPADAIVNAANPYLAHGGGVAGAIVAKGGSVIQAESNAWIKEYSLVRYDKPAYTSAGALPCKYVIHAVGPVWGEGEESHKLAVAIRTSLELADHLKLHSIAFPAISTGIFRYPVNEAASVILQAIRSFAQTAPSSTLQSIAIILLDEHTANLFYCRWVEIEKG